MLRSVFELPCRTHRYLLEPLSEFKHLFTLLTNRFIKFYCTLFFCDKDIISNLRRIQESDCRSNFASNIRNICRLNNTTHILFCQKDSVKYFPINEYDYWRVNLLKELRSLKESNTVPGFSVDEITFLIENVACS